MNQSNRCYQLSKSDNALMLTLATGTIAAPAAQQVLVQMHAASLNYRDLLTLQDSASTRDNLVPLSDGAGVVVAVGSAVTRWKLGDRVSPNFFPQWLGGPSSAAHLSQALGGGATDGVLSDYLLVNGASLAEIPAHLSYAEAATLPCAGLAAWHALFERGDIQAGDTVLVQGTGGVALMGLQLATAHGARVIVTSSSEGKLERARAIGAWKTINYRERPDWDQAVLELTDGLGVDHILELGGPDTYNRSIAAIGHGGRIAQIGVLTGFAPQPNMLPLQFKNANVNGICVGSVAMFERLNSFMAQHQLHPVIDQTFGFDAVPAAYAQLQAAGHFGKLVIELT